MKGAGASSTGPASRYLQLPWLKGNTPSKTHYFGNNISYRDFNISYLLSGMKPYHFVDPESKLDFIPLNLQIKNLCSWFPKKVVSCLWGADGRWPNLLGTD